MPTSAADLYQNKVLTAHRVPIWAADLYQNKEHTTHRVPTSAANLYRANVLTSHRVPTRTVNDRTNGKNHPHLIKTEPQGSVFAFSLAKGREVC